MKKLIIVLGLVICTTMAFSLTINTVQNGKTEYDKGYFIGTFFKDAKTGEIWKVIKVTDTEIWIAPFESGALYGQESFSEEETQ